MVELYRLLQSYIASLKEPLREGVEKFFENQQIQGPQDVCFTAGDLSDALQASLDVPTLGHKSAVREYVNMVHKAQSEMEPPPQTSPDTQSQGLDSLRAVFALAQGDLPQKKSSQGFQPRS